MLSSIFIQIVLHAQKKEFINFSTFITLISSLPYSGCVHVLMRVRKGLCLCAWTSARGKMLIVVKFTNVPIFNYSFFLPHISPYFILRITETTSFPREANNLIAYSYKVTFIKKIKYIQWNQCLCLHDNLKILAEFLRWVQCFGLVFF